MKYNTVKHSEKRFLLSGYHQFSSFPLPLSLCRHFSVKYNIAKSKFCLKLKSCSSQPDGLSCCCTNVEIVKLMLRPFFLYYQHNGEIVKLMLLSVMERKMRSSGMERLIWARTHHHVKDSEKHVLARKALMQRVRS